MPNKQKKYYLVVLLLLAVTNNIYTGDNTRCNLTRNQAEKNISELAYSKAILNYNKLLKWDCATIADIRNLAQAYFQLKNTEQSEALYSKIVLSDEAIDEDFYYYSQSLKSNKKYNESEKWFRKYQEISYSGSTETEDQSLVEKVNELSNKNAYTITLLPINSANSDFGALTYKDELIFISARNDKSIIQYESSLNAEPFLDIYITNFSKNDSSIKPFSKVINSRFHDGPICFNSDGSEIFVTRSRYNKKSKKNDFVLFYAFQENSSWNNLIELPFNSPEYSCGHPCLTADDKVLFFASDVPGGYGGADIYFTQKEEKGWSMPVNLGPNINTQGEEMFPFVSVTGDLYFSSDGHPGLGGLDIYMAQTNTEGSYEAINLGAPLNSSSDDFSFYLEENGKEGYFASNREGGIGSDDIYKFMLNNKNSYILHISTKNSTNGNILAGIGIQLEDKAKNQIAQQSSNSQGKIDFEIEADKEYIIKASKGNFKSRTIEFQSTKSKATKNNFYLTVFLSPLNHK